MAEDPSEFFWEVALDALALEGVERATMMGFPCLRLNGAFFASCDRASGDLIVKLASERVAELILAGEGEPFAPAGRVFREWMRVVERDRRRWSELIEEARVFAGNATREAMGKAAREST